VIERQTVEFQLRLELLEQLAGRTIRWRSGHTLADDLDKLPAQPSEQFGLHDCHTLPQLILPRKAIRSEANFSTCLSAFV
jgi:hypothetical protein